jgi:PEGA domain
MSPKISSVRLIGVGTALSVFAFFAAPAWAQHGGHSSHGSASHGSASHAGSGQHTASSPHSAPASHAAPRTAPATARSAAPATTMSAAGRTRPAGTAPVSTAVPRPENSIANGRRVVFSQPYYVFRPRFTSGIGLWVGYPVAFPYEYGSYYYAPYASYGYSSGYGSPYDYAYGSTYNSTYSRSGGVSFDITPVDAAVFIDGKYVGTVEDFSPTEPPLTVAAGRHRIDVRAQGYQTMSFDITVVPGQVIPYQGEMSLIR